MDVHIPKPVTVGLRLRRIDVLTSQEDGTNEWDDARLLKRATALRRLLVTHDTDLLREGMLLLKEQTEFFGIVYVHQLELTIGQLVENLD